MSDNKEIAGAGVPRRSNVPTDFGKAVPGDDDYPEVVNPPAARVGVEVEGQRTASQVQSRSGDPRHGEDVKLPGDEGYEEEEVLPKSVDPRVGTRATPEGSVPLRQAVSDDEGRAVTLLPGDEGFVDPGNADYHPDPNGPGATAAKAAERKLDRANRSQIGVPLGSMDIPETDDEARVRLEMQREGSYPGGPDLWAHRSARMRCATCMWFVVKQGNVTNAVLGRCRKRPPTMDGYPAVFLDDFCGSHKLDENKI